MTVDASDAVLIKTRWQSRSVVVVHGQGDTRLKNGQDYETRPLGSFWNLPPSSKPKRAGLAFMPSTYAGPEARVHKTQRERGEFVALVGDIDKGDHQRDKIEGLIGQFAGEAAHMIYTSPHARPENMRWRGIIPLRDAVDFETWHDAQTGFFDFMEANGVSMDWALARAGQIVYLPNVPALHVDSGTPLRDSQGHPLYFLRIASDPEAPGLRLDQGVPAAAIAAVRCRREEDERLREEMREEADRRRANRPQVEGDSVIDTFNRSVSIADLLASYGYEPSGFHSNDWKSRYQTSPSYATRDIGGKWISLSASDTDAGIGEKCKTGCYGDAYDLFVHFEHGGNRNAAWKAACEEQGRNRQPFQYPKAAPFRSEHPSAVEDDRRIDPDTGEIFDDPPPDGFPPDAEEQVDGGSAKSEYPEPMDLWARYDAPKLPLSLLPPIIEMLAVKQGDIMGVDPAGLAMAALTVCGAAISDDIAVRMKRHDPSWSESARLWVGMVGLASKKKSPILRVAVAPLKRINNQKMDVYQRALNEFNSLPASERKMATPPSMHRHMVSDSTIESLQVVLKDSPWGVLSEQDELSGWFAGMDKYNPGKGGSDRAFWLQAFNGGGYTIDRISRGSSHIRNLSVSLLGGIQPEPLRKVATETVDDGLIQRLIPVILAPPKLGRDAPNDGVVDDYNQLVEELIQLRAPARQGIPTLEETQRPERLQYTDGALRVRERLEAEHHGLVEALETSSPKLSAHFGKYDGLFGRLCVIWHCIEYSGEGRLPLHIGESTAQLVAGFMEKFIRPSAIAFYAGMLGLSDGHDTLMAVAALIVAEGLPVVNARDIQRSTRNLRSFDADDVRRICERLENFGWLDPIDPPSRSKTPRWAVNPRVHTMFAEKGKQDAERRKRAKAALKSALGG